MHWPTLLARGAHAFAYATCSFLTLMSHSRCAYAMRHACGAWLMLLSLVDFAWPIRTRYRDAICCWKTLISLDRYTYATSDVYRPWLRPPIISRCHLLDPDISCQMLSGLGSCHTTCKMPHMRLMCGTLGVLDSMTQILTQRSRHRFFMRFRTNMYNPNMHIVR